METKVVNGMRSNYCCECLKLDVSCEGKDFIQKASTFWGQVISKRQSGLNFCSDYEFDVRLYTFADGSGKVGKFKTIRKRQKAKDTETSNQEHVDIVDISETLKSSDFADLLV